LFFDFVDDSLPHPRFGHSDLPHGAGLGAGLGGIALRERLIDVEDATPAREIAQ